MSKVYLVIPYSLIGFGRQTSMFRLVFTATVSKPERTVTA